MALTYTSYVSQLANMMTSAANLQYPGQSANGAGVRRIGKFWVGWTQADPTIPSGTDANGDRWMFAANMTNGKLWCGVNGTWTSGDPAADTTPWVTGQSGTIYPAVGFWTGSGKVRLVVDSASFAYAAPSGFSAWNASP